MNRRFALPLGALLMGSVAGAADFSHYREFELGSELAVASLQPGVNTARSRVVQQRPTVIEESDWRPVFHFDRLSAEPDPVREVLLRFVDKKLFQIVVTYERQRIQGMTEADLIEAISGTYGPATNPGGEIAFRSNYGEKANVLAEWGDDQYVYSLVRTGDQSSFALIGTMSSLDAVAQESMREAHRLDVLEAPQRALDLEAKRAMEQQTMLEQARSANLPNFKP